MEFNGVLVLMQTFELERLAQEAALFDHAPLTGGKGLIPSKVSCSYDRSMASEATSIMINN